MYERFTNPTPPSFVTLISTTKLRLGLPNKVMSTCVLSKLELDELKKFGEREFSFEVFFIEFRESLRVGLKRNKLGNRVIGSSMGCVIVQLAVSILS